MDEPSELHAAANEAVFREVNEAIERGLWPGEEDARATFRCECSALECAVFLSLAPRDYERVRAGSRRFVVTPGHERWHPNPDFYYQPGGGPLLAMGPY